jgi:glycosyltransferase involved in cell wall biosynthesis
MKPRAIADILVVGQTPPPITGQSVMLQKMLEGRWEHVRLHHVRMQYSSSIDEVGRFRLGKLLELARLIGATVYHRTIKRIPVLYYPPAGPHLVPITRDIIFLIATRWLFHATIFHFHAAGLSHMYRRCPALLKPLMRLAFDRPDVAIRISPHAPEDGRVLRARREYIVPCGIEDEAAPYLEHRSSAKPHPTILYVGVLREDKGILVLLQALAQLRVEGMGFDAHFIGGFSSSAFAAAVKEAVRSGGLLQQVHFAGILTGVTKLQTYASADIFCFPSYFAAESFGVVLVEAMSFALPVVATNWRGIPSIVDDGKTGFLVPVRDPRALAERLRAVIVDPKLRREMGQRGRQKFLAQFTAAEYQRQLGEIFRSFAM